ncbi:MAG: hypothetical protein HDR38_08070 [Treponema sp.]|nr:hypothetical protein [Treponema sp.]
MTEFSIEIQRSVIDDELSRLTDYDATKRTDPTKREQLLIKSTDAEMIDRLWADSTSIMAERLAPFLADNQQTPGNLRLDFRLPDNFDPTHIPTIRTALESVLVHHIAGRWFAISERDAPQTYSDLARTGFETAIRLLRHRRRPSHQNPTCAETTSSDAPD